MAHVSSGPAAQTRALHPTAGSRAGGSAHPSVEVAALNQLAARARADAAAKALADARAQARAAAKAKQTRAAAQAKAAAKAKAAAQARAAAAARAAAEQAAAQPAAQPQAAQQSAAAPARAASQAPAPAPVQHVAAPVVTSVMTGAESNAAYAVLGLLNSERAAHGLGALRMNSQLLRSARAHNLMMAKYDTMSHQLPGEAYFTDRIAATGYSWQTAGENVGWNSDQSTSGALYLEKLMYNELPPNDGHRRNILNSAFRDVGIDVYFDAHTGKLWLTEDFGSSG
jgi:uncharacterized protein YkwD